MFERQFISENTHRFRGSNNIYESLLWWVLLSSLLPDSKDDRSWTGVKLDNLLTSEMNIFSSGEGDVGGDRVRKEFEKDWAVPSCTVEASTISSHSSKDSSVMRTLLFRPFWASDNLLTSDDLSCWGGDIGEMPNVSEWRVKVDAPLPREFCLNDDNLLLCSTNDKSLCR